MKDFAIIANSMHDELYNYSLSFYQHLPYDKIRVPGDNKFYNFKFINDIILNIEKYPYEWVALIDEDCFITDTNAFIDLLIYQKNNNIHVSGMPDGGLIPLREFNPVSINTYFTILNLKEIRKKYNPLEVNFTKYDNSLNKYIPHDIIKLPYFSNIMSESGKKCDPYNFEPYYRIFFWLLKNGFTIKYLDAHLWNSDKDKYTNILKNHNNVVFAYHTWRARNFLNNENKKRILNIIKEIQNKNV